MHEGHRSRVRKRFQKEGLDGFEQHQILELLLFYAIPRRDVNTIAHKLIKKFGSISRVFEATIEDIMTVEGIGNNAAILITLIPQICKAYEIDKWGKKPVLNSSSLAGEYITAHFTGRLYEAFFIVCLDAQNKVLFADMVFEGTIDEAPVYPRIIVEVALRHKAHSVILAHNHPGGSTIPSRADIESTDNIKKALKAVNIMVIDHIIIAGDKYSSFVEIGLLQDNF